jgi:RND superfamily putative drug exporter
MHRQIAGKLTGPVTKWIVLGAAIVLVAIMAPLNGKLVDVQNNEASSWLPGSAESTKVVEELTGTVDPNDIPTLVVYHRPGGLTDADLAAMDEDATKIAEIKGVTDKGAISPNGAAALAATARRCPS